MATAGVSPSLRQVRQHGRRHLWEDGRRAVVVQIHAGARGRGQRLAQAGHNPSSLKIRRLLAKLLWKSGEVGQGGSAPSSSETASRRLLSLQPPPTSKEGAMWRPPQACSWSSVASCAAW
eukprot:scaffold2979_cov243-Pinguiococcus_pyrenoidosus.AAC.16